MLSIFGVQSVLIPLGHIKVQLQINPVENLPRELCFREESKNKEKLCVSNQVTCLPVAVSFPSEPEAGD